jgi:hypothetical protein
VEREKNTLVQSFMDQWARTWQMWEAMIRGIPDAEWTKGDIDYLIPARHLIHVAVADDFFSADTPLDQYDSLGLFGVEDWGSSPDELPSKEAALDRLAEIRSTVEERLARLDDAALLEPETVHPWTGLTRLGKLIFNLRHVQHHLGEVNAELIRRGMDGVGWK